MPFNLAKSMLNAAVAIFLYKPIITALRRIGMAKKSASGDGMKLNKNSVVILVSGAILLALSITLLVIVW